MFMFRESHAMPEAPDHDQNERIGKYRTWWHPVLTEL